MLSKTVIGVGFGDEGKGLTTDYLCSQSQSPFVVRFSGGQQAGHTVVYNNIRHVFSNFGSGSLRGVPTYWAKYCPIDPIGIVNEMNVLKSKGITPILFIDERCPVTTPYDVYENINDEKIVRDGTCGVGVGNTLKREEAFYSLTFADLFHPAILQTRLLLIKNYYKTTSYIDRFLECCNIITNSENIKSVYGLSEIYKLNFNFETLIFEGSQGLLLDKQIGFFPNVTRSSVSSKNMFKICDNLCDDDDKICVLTKDIYFVTRAYQTRHGNGFMTNENIPHNIKIDESETNVKNKYQGDFRRSLLDADLIRYAIRKDEYVMRLLPQMHLVITCLDHIFNEYRFTHKGKIVYCNDENDFIEKLNIAVGVYDVFTSHTANSENIKKHQ